MDRASPRVANDSARSRTADPVERLLLKFRARDVVSAEEEEVLRKIVADIREIPQGRVLVRANVALSECTLLIDGFVARYKDLADGQRQIMEIHVPGDFLDLHSFLLKRLEHNVGAMTPVRIAVVPHEAIRQITESHPHLGRILWFSTLLDAALHRERILSVGRRTALARIAHLMCELYMRLEIVGLARDFHFSLPLTQTDISDACGLTSVHVNRMLKKLRDDGLLTFRSGEVVIHDWERLQRVGEFSPGFLYVERRPR
jgi:CRP-like cAMP-binding protein